MDNLKKFWDEFRKGIRVRSKKIALLMAMVLTIQLLSGCASGAVQGLTAAAVGTAGESDARLSKTVIDDLSAYEDRQVLAFLENGETELYSCSSDEELSGQIETLAARDDVSVVQPNYSYEDQAFSVNDALIGEQWALLNDGSFSIEEEKNRYPVYNDPFGSPFGPGQWRNPEGDSGPGWQNPRLIGVVVEVATKTAAAGIDLNITEAWNRYGSGSRETIVAMIDTGIDYNHEDLAGAVWVNRGEIPDNGIDDDGNGYTDDVHGWNFFHGNNQVYMGSEDSHGTHGAGTIAAAQNNGIGISGIAPGDKVKVMAVKALGGSQGGGSTASLIKAIRYAEDNGAVICNLSLATTTNDRALYQAMANSSMLFVVAAGNGDERTGQGLNADEVPSYPAAYDLDNIISVANLSFDGSLHYSSNFGAASVDLAAPGSYILSTIPNNSYGYMTGTSMAAPMVSGAAAMLYSYYDQISLADVKEILLSSARRLDSLQGVTVSGGMLDVGAAMGYDLGRLSGRGFSNSGASPENGTAPFIEARLSERSSGTYLVIRVVDIDGDLEQLTYEPGNLTAENFNGGTVGSGFVLNAQDTATFQIDEAGTYTFYARDSRGNETVKVVKISAEGDGPGA